MQNACGRLLPNFRHENVRTRSTGEMAATPRRPRVCIVGAGLAGLSAGREIAHQASTVVLEAAYRPGGRTLSGNLSTEPCAVDAGGQWVGPKQHEVLKLVKEFNCTLQPQYATGIKTVELAKAVRTYTGLVPNVSIAVLVDAQLMIWLLTLFQYLAYISWISQRMDGITVERFMQRVAWTQGARALVAIVVQALFGHEPDELSLLAFLRYVNASGNIEAMTETGPGSLQAWTILGGSAQLSERLAGAIASRPGCVVRCNTKVVAITLQTGNAEGPVAVSCNDGSVEYCDHVVLAVPPPLLASVSFSPSLSPSRLALCDRATMGGIIKCLLVYKRAFWRKAGHSGEVICDTSSDPSARATFNVFDNCLPRVARAASTSTPDGAGHTPRDYAAGIPSKPSPEARGALVSTVVDGDGLVPMLVCFINGARAREFSRLSQHDKKAVLISQLVTWFGPEAAEPTEYFEKDWVSDPFTRGCPISSYAPGVLSAFGLSRQLRAPEWALAPPGSPHKILHRLHFAGTETSDVSTGFMDGAIRSGLAAAKEVLRDLSVEWDGRAAAPGLGPALLQHQVGQAVVSHGLRADSKDTSRPLLETA